MEIKFSCPHCSQDLSGTVDHIGILIDCPTCSYTFEVPSMSDLASTPGVPAKSRRRKSPMSRKQWGMICAVASIVVLGLTLWLRKGANAEPEGVARSFEVTRYSLFGIGGSLSEAERRVVDALMESYVEIGRIQEAGLALVELKKFPGGSWSRMTIDQAEAAISRLQRKANSGLASQKTVESKFAEIQALMNEEWPGTPEIKARIVATTNHDSGRLKTSSGLSALKAEIRSILAHYKVTPKEDLN